MFVHPLLLGGFLLLGIPVLIHLTMRQKPKRLLFPALRFLQQRAVSNARSLRLRHLLLLALRVLLIVLACLALARLRLFSGGILPSSDRPVAAVLVFDTTPSMEYTVAGQSRLAEAQRRAEELLAELPEGSHVAVLDTSDPAEDWEPTVAEARRKVRALELWFARPRLGVGNGTVSSQLAKAYRLFGKLEQEGEESAALPQVLYVFSDRTRACWDGNEVKDLPLPDKVRAAFIDVGVEKPRDLAIAGLDIQPGELVYPGLPIRFLVTVRAAANPGDAERHEAEVHFRIKGEEKWDIQPISLLPGETSKPLVFARKAILAGDPRTVGGLEPGFYQAEVKFGSNDALPSDNQRFDAMLFDNQRFATFEVRENRRVLVLSDSDKDAFSWTFDLQHYHLYQCTVKTPKDLGALGVGDLANYSLVCLVRLSNPGASLWRKLTQYVEAGGRAIVVPGGEEWIPKSYDDDEATKFLPAHLVEKQVVGPKDLGTPWPRDLPRHPLLEAFREWKLDNQIDFVQEEGLPRAYDYWVVQPYDPRGIIVAYRDEKHPALVERNLGHGRVLLFTTAFDYEWPDVNRRDRYGRPWHNYNQSSFQRVLINLAANYMAGDSERPVLNFAPGQRVPVPLPPGARATTYTLQGPGIVGNDGVVTPDGEQPLLSLDQAVQPGNYTVYDGQARRVIGAFSLNVPAAECRLERVDAEEIDKALGPGAVVPVARARSLHDVLEDRWPQPFDPFPWLMIGVLLLLAGENLLSNRFYGRTNKEAEAGALVAAPAANGNGQPAALEKPGREVPFATSKP